MLAGDDRRPRSQRMRGPYNDGWRDRDGKDVQFGKDDGRTTLDGLANRLRSFSGCLGDRLTLLLTQSSVESVRQVRAHAVPCLEAV